MERRRSSRGGAEHEPPASGDGGAEDGRGAGSVPDAPPGEAEPLYGVPLARFVAERNQLAAALARSGSPTAEAVRRLARPTRRANVLNRLARAHGAEVAALLEAGARLRRGQRRALSGAGAEDLREAERAVQEAARTLRSAIPPLLAEAGEKPLAPGDLAELELALRVAATGGEADRERLRRGVFTREPERAGFGELAGLAALPGGSAARAPAASSRASAPAERAHPPPSPVPPARGAEQGRREARATAARVAREAREARQAQEAEARAEREARAAREAAQRAEAQARARALTRAREAVARAEVEVKRRAAEVEAAERRAAEARARHAAAEEALAKARAQLGVIE